jgi:hypothetical protein
MTHPYETGFPLLTSIKTTNHQILHVQTNFKLKSFTCVSVLRNRYCVFNTLTLQVNFFTV